MTKRILVVGIGNTLRRDDGVGIITVQHLLEGNKSPNVTLTTAFQLQPEMVTQFILADRLILVDANAEIRPGVIQRKTLKPEQPSTKKTQVSHFITPQCLLALCAELYGYAPETELFSIGGYDFTFGEGLSAIVRIRLRRLIDAIESEIQNDEEVSAYV